jgi:hypothetical protein
LDPSVWTGRYGEEKNLVLLGIIARKVIGDAYRCGVLTTMVTKRYIFWDITPYNLLKFSRRFGGICRLYRPCGRISRARNQSESRWEAEL